MSNNHRRRVIRLVSSVIGPPVEDDGVWQTWWPRVVVLTCWDCETWWVDVAGVLHELTGLRLPRRVRAALTRTIATETMTP